MNNVELEIINRETYFKSNMFENAILVICGPFGALRTTKFCGWFFVAFSWSPGAMKLGGIQYLPKTSRIHQFCRSYHYIFLVPQNPRVNPLDF